MSLQHAGHGARKAQPQLVAQKRMFSWRACEAALALVLFCAVFAPGGALATSFDGLRNEPFGTVPLRRILQAGGARNAPTTAPAPSPGSLAGQPDLSRYDLYTAIKLYAAESGNVTTQATSLWMAVEYTTGASWNVSVPYFASGMSRPESIGIGFAEFIFPDDSVSGCVTANITSNVSSSGNLLVFNGSEAVPFSVCNGTCSKTTPVAAGYAYFFGSENNAKTYFNATLRYTAYPSDHPVCLASLMNLTTADLMSKYLNDTDAAAVETGDALDLSSEHYLAPGAVQVLWGVSNTSCLRLSTYQQNASSGSLALYSEASLGIALRHNADPSTTGLVTTNTACSFGPNRNTSLAGCEINNGTLLQATGLDPKSRYFLVGQNNASLPSSFIVIKNIYSADSCQLSAPLFNETKAAGLPALVSSAQQASTAQAPALVASINNAIVAAATR